MLPKHENVLRPFRPLPHADTVGREKILEIWREVHNNLKENLDKEFSETIRLLDTSVRKILKHITHHKKSQELPRLLSFLLYVHRGTVSDRHNRDKINHAFRVCTQGIDYLCREAGINKEDAISLVLEGVNHPRQIDSLQEKPFCAYMFKSRNALVHTLLWGYGTYHKLLVCDLHAEFFIKNQITLPILKLILSKNNAHTLSKKLAAATKYNHDNGDNRLSGQALGLALQYGDAEQFEKKLAAATKYNHDNGDNRLTATALGLALQHGDAEQFEKKLAAATKYNHDNGDNRLSGQALGLALQTGTAEQLRTVLLMLRDIREIVSKVPDAHVSIFMKNLQRMIFAQTKKYDLRTKILHTIRKIDFASLAIELIATTQTRTRRDSVSPIMQKYGLTDKRTAQCIMTLYSGSLLVGNRNIMGLLNFLRDGYRAERRTTHFSEDGLGGSISLERHLVETDEHSINEFRFDVQEWFSQKGLVIAREDAEYITRILMTVGDDAEILLNKAMERQGYTSAQELFDLLTAM